MQKLSFKFIFMSLLLIISGLLCCFSLMMFPSLILEQNDVSTNIIGYYYLSIFLLTSLVLYILINKYFKNNVA